MPQTPKTTQTQTATQSTAPLLGSDQLKGILGAAPSASSLATTPYEQTALDQLQQNGTSANQFTQGLTGAATNALNGGGYGQANTAITTALNQSNANLTPYANGQNLDPTTNPAYASLLHSIQSSVNNNVGDQFAAAGRSFSGAHAGALGTAETNALAPYLFGQYNTNVGNQLNANNMINANAQNASGALNQSAGGTLAAQAQAPTAISNINTPAAMQLAAGQQQQQFPIQNLQGLSSLLLPIAQGGGTTGTGSSTGTQQQQGNTLQQLLGGGIGAIGALGQSGAFGTAAGGSGWLGAALSGLGTAIPFL